MRSTGPTFSYGEATGITQTIRNYGASLGLAILGTILLSVQRSQLTASLRKLYPGLHDAAQVAASRSQSQAGTSTMHIPQYFRIDFAHAIEVVLYVMCGIMALAAVVAFIGLERGLQEMPPEPGEDTEPPDPPPIPPCPPNRLTFTRATSVTCRFVHIDGRPTLIRIRSHEEGSMPETTQFTIGAEVSCSDGPAEPSSRWS